MTATTLREQPPASFVRATSQLLAGSVAAQVLVALTFAYAARSLGRPVFGLVVTLLGVAAVGQDLVDFGTSQWLSREIAACRLSLGVAQAALRRRTQGVGLLCAIIGTAALLGGASLPLVAGLAIYIVGALTNAGAHARLRALGAFRRAAWHLVAERAAWLACTIVVVAVHPSRSVAAALLVGGMGVSYAVSSACARGISGDPRGVSPLALGTMYRRAAPFGWLGLSTDLQQLDASVAALVVGVDVAAEVGVASKLSGPLAMIAGAITQVTFRGVATGGEQAKGSARSGLRLAGLLALGLAAISPLLPALTVLVLGSQYTGARTAVLVYALATAIAVVNQPLAGVLTARGQERAVSRIVVTAVLVGLCFGALTVSSWGAPGMGAGFVLTQLIILAGCVTSYRTTRWRTTGQ
jgi:O-antigen/teichoic acid export membrane protein